MKKTILTLGFLLSFFSYENEVKAEGNPYSNSDMTIHEVIDVMDKYDGVTIIDVRNASDIRKTGKILDATTGYDFDSSSFNHKISQLDKNGDYILYSLFGDNSEKAKERMKKLGFKKVHDIEGGLDEWSRNGFPMAGRPEPVVSEVVEEVEIEDDTSSTPTQPQKVVVTSSGSNLSPKKALGMIKSGNIVLIDVRTPAEIKQTGRIPGALTGFDFTRGNQWWRKTSELDKNKTYIVYCRTGNKSELVKKRMTKSDLGFKNVYDIDGGTNAWASEGLSFN